MATIANEKIWLALISTIPQTAVFRIYSRIFISNDRHWALIEEVLYYIFLLETRVLQKSFQTRYQLLTRNKNISLGHLGVGQKRRGERSGLETRFISRGHWMLAHIEWLGQGTHGGWLLTARIITRLSKKPKPTKGNPLNTMTENEAK